MRKPFRLSIKLLFLSLLAFAMIGTIAASVISSVIVSKNNLEENYLIENQYYAQKLATTTDHLFTNMLQILSTESHGKEYVTTNSEAIYHEIKRILDSTTFFNSTIFVDDTGLIIASAPDRTLEGKRLKSVGSKEALKQKAPFISKPYVGVSGNLILLISAPVFDEHGSYKGFLSGTIHLQKENSLKRVLGQHPKHENDSYVYVVDSEGNIIYHPDQDRINENVKENKVVQQVLEGKNGSQEVTNTQGISMLAGYASSTSASKWGIISQTPKTAVIKPTIQMAKQVGINAVPIFILVFALSLFILNKIVNPIRNLAVYAKEMTSHPSIPPPRIPNWYFELKELKRALLVAVDFYQKKLTSAESESNLDPLTGFYNRRSLEKRVSELDMYSIILFDVDYFKTVNDQNGHQMGDEVLIYLSELVKKATRESDWCFRLGGDEFLIVLPETGPSVAQTIAERIRKTAEDASSPIGEPLTVSIGIGHFPTTAQQFSELVKVTDEALYRAKQLGRNRAVMARRRE
ncbi:hypothetical protein COJ96_02560 [Bacillus sp. AFS073361]|uniref:sensor domain-containing diguanylate cyclase n=1 Tax=Bacillus sp. AFS073361 TaxID=2033511 RepID=UPI000BF82F55|nr:sensor domain-containing diguanylate cyclase [Bacillus sp. AFS073361]PFP30864.1 hypothetical protein COJ96_02560 [Bacillus sp. AFS073361]